MTAKRFSAAQQIGRPKNMLKPFSPTEYVIQEKSKECGLGKPACDQRRKLSLNRRSDAQRAGASHNLLNIMIKPVDVLLHSDRSSSFMILRL
jgi:hypothetical protein